MSKVKCEGCGEEAPSYEITHYGSMDGVNRQLCSHCFSAEVAKASGVATLHQQVLAVGAFWNRAPNQNQLLLAVSRRRRAWFEGLWANAGHPPVLPVQAKIG
ncbi:MAG: hypothetical protein WCH01_03200 [Methylococcaceae bacterium]